MTATALISGIAVVPTASKSQASPMSQTFTLSFSSESFTVPAGVTRLSIDIVAGSDDWNSALGGRVIADISVTPGEILQILVGGAGNATTGRGGFPDGGDGGGQVSISNASGGGGSTSIRDNSANSNVIAIAGGGGGGTNFTQGGAGGFPWGGDGHFGYVNRDDMNGKGATQSAGGIGGCEFDTTCPSVANGALGQGGTGSIGGGGGGGLYGGGAGGGGIDNTDVYSASGGGGSSWVDPTRLFPSTSVTYQPGYFPNSVNEWRDGNGWATLTWTPAPATTIPSSTIAATTSSSPTTTTTPPSSNSGSDSNNATTTSVASTTTSTTTTLAPTWSSQPDVEREVSIVGTTPFPSSGRGSVVVVNEGGYVVNAKNVFTPRWRTRVYIGTFKFSLRATYMANKKRRTYACTFPKFGTESKIAASRKWRWYSPPRGCTLPKDLVTQLAQGKTTMQFTGSFTRKWATSGKSIRPDGSRIDPFKISLVIAGSESVAVN